MLIKRILLLVEVQVNLYLFHNIFDKIKFLGIGFLPNIIKTASPLIWYATSGDVTSHTMRYRYYVKYITKYMISKC